MSRHRQHNFVSFTDLLFNLVVGITFLFLLAFILIKPDGEKKIDSKAEFVITMEWPDHHNGDVDLWVKDPGGQAIGFQSRELGVTSLERDDLGSQTDTHWINGDQIYNPKNREITTIRAIVPGTWTVNVHYYTSRPIPPNHISGQKNPPYSDPKKIPVEVTVTVVKLNPHYSTVIRKTLLLTFQGEERTIVQFDVTKEGKVQNITSKQERFVIGAEQAGAF